MKGQVSIEYVVMTASVLVLLGAGFVFVGPAVTDNIALSQAQASAKNIADTINRAYALGPGTKLQTNITLPEGVISSEVREGEVGFVVNAFGQSNSIFEELDINYTGVLPQSGGNYLVIIQVGADGLVTVAPEDDTVVLPGDPDPEPPIECEGNYDNPCTESELNDYNYVQVGPGTTRFVAMGSELGANNVYATDTFVFRCTGNQSAITVSTSDGTQSEYNSLTGECDTDLDSRGFRLTLENVLYDEGNDDCYNYPTTVICHKPGTPAERTMTVSEPALPAHLAQGDYSGICPDNDDMWVEICHKPGTPAENLMEIQVAALDGHLAHGDFIGTCEEFPCDPSGYQYTVSVSSAENTAGLEWAEFECGGESAFYYPIGETVAVTRTCKTKNGICDEEPCISPY